MKPKHPNVRNTLAVLQTRGARPKDVPERVLPVTGRAVIVPDHLFTGAARGRELEILIAPADLQADSDAHRLTPLQVFHTALAHDHSIAFVVLSPPTHNEPVHDIPDDVHKVIDRLWQELEAHGLDAFWALAATEDLAPPNPTPEALRTWRDRVMEQIADTNAPTITELDLPRGWGDWRWPPWR